MWGGLGPVEGLEQKFGKEEGPSCVWNRGLVPGWDGFDLEDGGPLFAGDEDAIVFGVKGDAVEDGLGVDALRVGEESGEVDPGDDVAVAGRDAGDAVGVPDVGVDLAVDPLELVELVDDLLAIVDENVAGFAEGVGVAEAEVGGAVAGDEFGGGAGHAPAFAGVGELLEEAEGEAVVDEADVGLPGPLVEVGSPVDDALAEDLGWRLGVLDDFPGGGLRDEDGGVAGEAGALVEEAVEVEEAFGVVGGGMGVGVDDAVAEDWCGVGGCGEEGGAQGEGLGEAY